jgi:hypothetical protein
MELLSLKLQRGLQGTPPDGADPRDTHLIALTRIAQPVSLDTSDLLTEHIHQTFVVVLSQLLLKVDQMKVDSCGRVIRAKCASERALRLHFYCAALHQDSLF